MSVYSLARIVTWGPHPTWVLGEIYVNILSKAMPYNNTRFFSIWELSVWPNPSLTFSFSPSPSLQVQPPLWTFTALPRWLSMPGAPLSSGWNFKTQPQCHFLCKVASITMTGRISRSLLCAAWCSCGTFPQGCAFPCVASLTWEFLEDKNRDLLGIIPHTALGMW